MNTYSMFFSLKDGWKRLSGIAALENPIISLFTFEENGSVDHFKVIFFNVLQIVQTSGRDKGS